ncbi:MAG: diacylglycerol kinase family protein [Sphingomicrobium sp.]
MKAIILINRSGGTAKGDPDIGPKVEAAMRAAGIEGEVELLDGAGVARRAKEAVAAKAPLVIVGGGDGSQSAAAGAIAGTDTILGVLPLGTLNHLARDLGIPFDIDQAAAIIGAGHEQRIDVAELNGRVFVNNSALGLYPLMVVDRDAQQKRLGRSKKLAMAVAAARTIARFRHSRVTICADGERVPIETPLLFIGNNDYDTALPNPGKRTSLSDGKLCVLVLRKKGRWGLFAAATRALLGITRDDDMIRLDAVDELRVESHRSPVTVSIDGETEKLKSPLTYKIRKGALRVIAPMTPDASSRA